MALDENIVLYPYEVREQATPLDILTHATTTIQRGVAEAESRTLAPTSTDIDSMYRVQYKPVLDYCSEQSASVQGERCS